LGGEGGFLAGEGEDVGFVGFDAGFEFIFVDSSALEFVCRRKEIGLSLAHDVVPRFHPLDLSRHLPLLVWGRRAFLRRDGGLDSSLILEGI
jgi:hypothetical protein